MSTRSQRIRTPDWRSPFSERSLWLFACLIYGPLDTLTTIFSESVGGYEGVVIADAFYTTFGFSGFVLHKLLSLVLLLLCVLLASRFARILTFSVEILDTSVTVDPSPKAIRLPFLGLVMFQGSMLVANNLYVAFYLLQ